MNLQTAKEECQRWLRYLEEQKIKSNAITKLASDVRKGILTSDVARNEIRKIDNNLTVYDGSNLAKAVETILKLI